MQSISSDSVTATSLTYEWTIYSGAANTTPALREALTWPEIGEAIRKMVAEAAPSKKTMLAVGPYRLREGAARAADKVEHVSLVALDVDRDLPDVAALVERIRSAGVAAIVHTSPSDAGPAAATRKVRIYLRPSRPMTPAEARAVRVVMARELGVTLDPSTSNADRIYFAGVIEGTAPREVWELDGADVPVDDALAEVPAVAETAAPPATPAAEDRELTEAEQASLDELAALIEPHYIGPSGGMPGQRNPLAVAIGGLLRNADLPPSAAKYVMAQLPSDDPRVRLRDALGAWSVPSAAGASALRAIVGETAWPAIEAVDLRPQWQRDARARVERRQAERDAAAAQPANDGAPANDAPDDPFAALGTCRAWTEPEEAIEYVCPALCIGKIRGKITLLAGQPGAAKGPLADYTAVCLALGRKLFGAYPVTQCNVAIIDHEGAILTRQRIRRMCQALRVDPAELDGHLWVFDATAARATSGEYHAALATFVAQHNIGAVVIDSYTSAMLDSGTEANQPEFAQLAKALGSLGIAVIAIAHANKAADTKQGEPRLSDVAYSGALSAMAATAIVLTRPEETDESRIKVWCVRAPTERFAPFEVRFEGTAPGPLAVRLHAPTAGEPPDERKRREHAEVVAKRADRIEAALRASAGGLATSASAVRKLLSMNNDVWSEALAVCLTRSSVRVDSGTGRGAAVAYVEPEHRPRVSAERQADANAAEQRAEAERAAGHARAQDRFRARREAKAPSGGAGE